MIKRRTIPILPMPEPPKAKSGTPAPLRKSVDPLKAQQVEDSLRATIRQNALSEESDYARVMRRYEERVHNPMTAIRARCIQCCVGQPWEVAKCTCTHCALHPFRMGVNPFNKKTAERLARDGAEAEQDEDDIDDETEEVDR